MPKILFIMFGVFCVLAAATFMKRRSNAIVAKALAQDKAKLEKQVEQRLNS